MLRQMLETIGLSNVPLLVIMIMAVLILAIAWTAMSMRPNKGAKPAYQIEREEHAYLLQLQEARDNGDISYDDYEQRVDEMYGR